MARFVRISQPEVDSVRKLYESVMSYACHGLFFREGIALADAIVREVGPGEGVLAGAGQVLVERGWVEQISFGDATARASGSIEVSPGSEAPTCHRLRGIVSRLFEVAAKRRVRFAEVACVSTGARECFFEEEK